MGASRRLQLVGVVLLFAMLLSGCQQAEPTAAAVVTLGPPLPPPATPTARVHPTIVTPVVAAAMTATPPEAIADTPTSETAERPSEGIALTVLHSNDVNGYIDPCG